MLREKEARTIVVAFRGADSMHVQGLITDVAMAPVPAVFGSTVTNVRPRLWPQTLTPIIACSGYSY